MEWTTPFGLPVEPEVYEVLVPKLHCKLKNSKARKQTHVEDEERILGSHPLARAVSGHLGTLFVPPFVTAFSHGDLVAGSSKNENVLNKGALLESGIDD